MGARRELEGAGEFGAIERLIRNGQFDEALNRALRGVMTAGIGWKSAARFHMLICAVHTTGFQRGAMAAILHGEEAVRLAERISDPWLCAESLWYLSLAHLLCGAPEKAAELAHRLAHNVEGNRAVLPGGEAAVLYLTALVACYRDEHAHGRQLLNLAEAQIDRSAPDVLARIRTLTVTLLLDEGCTAEARRYLRKGLPESDRDDSLVLVWALAWVRLLIAEQRFDQARSLLNEAMARAVAWPGLAAESLSLQAALVAADDPQEGSRLARKAVERAIAIGRSDLVRRYCRQLGPLFTSRSEAWPPTAQQS